MFRDPRAASDGQDALEATLDLERHAPRALAVGLFLAAMLHATCIAYGKLMPPEPRPKLFPIVVKPIEVDLAPAVAPPVVVPYEIEETTIEVPVPRAPTSARATSPPAPVPPPPAVSGTPMAAIAAVPEPPAVAPIATFIPPPPPPRPTGPDRSTPARLGGNVTWKCPFPKEADPEMLHVVVRAQAEIRADGTAREVTILSDPGYGFGRAARLCALSQTFVPGRGHDGQPADGPSLPFSVHFDKY